MSFEKEKTKILFVYQTRTSFIKKDIEILRSAYEVRELSFHGFVNIFSLFRGVLWCDVTFSWFGSIHAFFTVFFSNVFGKKSIVVAGGHDVAREPEIKYGMFLYWWKRWCPVFVFRYADLILPVSRSNEKETLVNTRVDPKKVKMIYHGFSANLNGIDAPLEKEKIVITIGTVSSETIITKGLKLFVESAKLLPDTKYLLIGPDKDGALNRLKETAPINVEFLGGIYGLNLVELCGRAKVYVQASVHESFGCSLAEAMLCECIPVVSRNGAIPEVVGDTGLYLDELTAEKLAEKVKCALAIPEDFGKLARNRIIEKFPLTKRREEILEAVRGLRGIK